MPSSASGVDSQRFHIVPNTHSSSGSSAGASSSASKAASSRASASFASPCSTAAEHSASPCCRLRLRSDSHAAALTGGAAWPQHASMARSSPWRVGGSSGSSPRSASRRFCTHSGSCSSTVWISASCASSHVVRMARASCSAARCFAPAPPLLPPSPFCRFERLPEPLVPRFCLPLDIRGGEIGCSESARRGRTAHWTTGTNSA